MRNGIVVDLHTNKHYGRSHEATKRKERILVSYKQRCFSALYCSIGESVGMSTETIPKEEACRACSSFDGKTRPKLTDVEEEVDEEREELLSRGLLGLAEVDEADSLVFRKVEEKDGLGSDSRLLREGGDGSRVEGLVDLGLS